MKNVLLILFLVCISFSLSSQILNVDKVDTSAYSPKTKYSGNISCGLEIDKQKEILYDATNTAELMRQKNKNLFIFGASYRFTYNGENDILNAGYLHLRYRYGYKAKFQPEPFIQYQWDNKRGLVHRYLTGINARALLHKNEKVTTNIALGLMYEDERWDYTAVDSSKLPLNREDIIQQQLKINSYLRVDWNISSTNSLSIKCFLQNNFSSFHPRISPLLQWQFQVNKRLSYSLNFSGMYDDKPVVPINNFFFSFSNNLVFAF